MELLKGQLVVCANGLISRETFTIRDRAKNFYMIGSMGLASSIGLGVALSKPSRKSNYTGWRRKSADESWLFTDDRFSPTQKSFAYCTG